MTTIPIDVLVHIIDFIDRPADLLSFALTARTFHTIIIPRHIDYRRISYPGSFKHVWKHLLDTPYDACSRIRYLNILSVKDQSRIKIPRMCQVERESDSPRMLDNDELLIQALSKMVNLKVFKFQTLSRNDEEFFRVSEAVQIAGCDLEELGVSLKWVNRTMEKCFRNEVKVSKESKKFSLLYDYRPSLRKYVLKSGFGCTSGSPFLQMLLNAPNLTHMNVTLTFFRTFLSGYWPNLQHLRIRFYGPDPADEDYIPRLQTFFYRHSKLIILSSTNVLLPGWAVGSDDLLPNLKSFFIDTLNYSRPTITTNIAARLVHLRMDNLFDYLTEHGIILSNLETCVLSNPISKRSIEDLVDMIPNVQKLYITFGTIIKFGTIRIDPNSEFTPDMATDCVSLLSSLKKLRVLIGPFEKIYMDNLPPRLLKVFYEFPSLLYTRMLFKRGSGRKAFRLERDDITKVMRLRHEKVVFRECDPFSWDSIYKLEW